MIHDHSVSVSGYQVGARRLIQRRRVIINRRPPTCLNGNRTTVLNKPRGTDVSNGM